MKIIVFAILSVSLLFANIAVSDTIPINPGLWESTTTNFNPLTGQQESETNVECEVEDKFDPASMIEQNDGCEIAESHLVGDILTFIMSCDMEGGNMIMRGEYRSDGDNAQGIMDMEFSYGGQVFNSTGTWSAKRIGDC